MKRHLHVAASPSGPDAYSWRLAETLLAKLGGDVVLRRLDLDPPPPPDAAFVRDFRAAQTAETAALKPSMRVSETLIGELETTGGLVISTPMHNFTAPAALKAWLDQVVRFGRTFQSTPDGKIGLLADRPTFVVIAAGGLISPPDALQPDFLRPYLSAILDCIGIRDVTFIAAEGLARGDAALAAGMAKAEAAIAAAVSPAPIRP